MRVSTYKSWWQEWVKLEAGCWLMCDSRLEVVCKYEENVAEWQQQSGTVRQAEAGQIRL